MSEILSTVNTASGPALVYHYKSLREIDDIILQLLNEASAGGFLEGVIHKEDRTLVYKVDGLIPLPEYMSRLASREQLADLIDQLRSRLAFLEDSFIDIDYVVFEEDLVFVDPDKGELVLTVLPCQSQADSTDNVRDLIRYMISHAKVELPDAGLQEEINKALSARYPNMKAFKEVVSLIRSGKSEMDVTDDVMKSIESELLAATGAVAAEKTQEAEKEKAAEETAAEETAVEEAAAEEVHAEKTSTEETQTEESQAEEVQTIELKAEEIRTEEVMTREVQTEEAQSVEETEVAEEAEVSEETEADQAEEDVEETSAYLIRKKSGEVIPLNKGAFVIGKLPICCDYVVSDNPSLSRVHAVIHYHEEDGKYYIADCNSTNHIYLDGRRMAGDALRTLEDKMHIHLANEAFICHLKGQ